MLPALTPSTTITKSFSLRTSNTLIVYRDKLSYSCVPENVDNNINTITVLGFNSSRFDSNLFKQYFNTNHWKVECNSIIGTLSSLKQFVLISSKYPTKLRFIDAQAFVAGGTLNNSAEILALTQTIPAQIVVKVYFHMKLSTVKTIMMFYQNPNHLNTMTFTVISIKEIH